MTHVPSNIPHFDVAQGGDGIIFPQPSIDQDPLAMRKLTVKRIGMRQSQAISNIKMRKTGFENFS